MSRKRGGPTTPAQRAVSLKASRAAAGLSKPGLRKLDAAETRDRLKADRLLNRLTLKAVRALQHVLADKRSTHMDLISASREVLDRKFPKMTANEIELRAMAPVIVRLERPWPAMDSGWEECTCKEEPFAVGPVPSSTSVAATGNGGNGHG